MPKSARATRPTLYVFVRNHFDPTWRRCFLRRFESGGRVFVSYADLEAYYMLDNLDLARRHPEYKFEAESALVARTFLERHPERLGELQRLAREGRFAISGAGENIVDGNMPLGESLVRNYLLGLLWTEKTFGAPTRIANRADGFGNCAQFPQILRGCEFDAVEHLSYTRPQGRYWRGLDGTTILCHTIPEAAWVGGNAKYAPCPECDGLGCRKCAGRGIDAAQRAIVPDGYNADNVRRGGCGFIMSAPEELLPNEALVDWVRRERRTSGFDVRFALQSETLSEVAGLIAAADAAPASELHPSPELNPNNAGCWVTRIKTKQVARRQEYALLGAESLAALAFRQGGKYPAGALTQAWRDLLFTQFHDAITATHVDPAYEEIQDFWRAIDAATGRVRTAALTRLTRPKRGALAVVNAWGQASGVQEVEAVVAARSENVAVRDEAGNEAPVIAADKMAPGRVRVRFLAEGLEPFSARNYRVSAGSARPAVRKLAAPVIRNQRFRVEADEHGILAIHDKRLRADVAARGDYRPAELVLEHDEGSPWATLHPDQTRTPLADKTRFVAAEKGAGYERLIFETGPTGGGFGTPHALAARLVVTLLDGADRVDFRLHAHWETFNHRLRVAMPAPFRGKHVYGIPYGSLNRQPYAPSFEWIGANGDWPAVNWAGIEGRERSVALLSKGLPSYRIEDAARGKGSTMFLSVLRSPMIPTYLHEPEFYTMMEFGGMRDAGAHDFEFALAAYGGPFWDDSVVLDAEAYNAGLVAAEGEALCAADGRLDGVPVVASGDSVRIAALKRAEEGRDLIVRLAEFRGRAAQVRVMLPAGTKRAEKVNLLERQGQPLAIENGAVALAFRPWEIATLRLS